MLLEPSSHDVIVVAALALEQGDADDRDWRPLASVKDGDGGTAGLVVRKADNRRWLAASLNGDGE
jgi:hypothetical protein